jgi:hypothetical protein
VLVPSLLLLLGLLLLLLLVAVVLRLFVGGRLSYRGPFS